MASERQVAANRINAKRSTGPKTPTGKEISRLNAYVHGLSRPGLLEVPSAAEVNSIADLLSAQSATEDQRKSAEDYARSHIELRRIQGIRDAEWAKVNRKGWDLEDLRRLASLDRYTRYALTQRRKASKNLAS
jgi:hypothetical protein